MSTMALRSSVVASPAAGPVRLTRRGRLVVVLGFLAALLLGGVTLGHAPSQASGRTHPVQPRTITVQAGDTLWTVAERIAPKVDPRLVVAQIQQLNHLRSDQLLAGTPLVVPEAR